MKNPFAAALTATSAIVILSLSGVESSTAAPANTNKVVRREASNTYMGEYRGPYSPSVNYRPGRASNRGYATNYYYRNSTGYLGRPYIHIRPYYPAYGSDRWWNHYHNPEARRIWDVRYPKPD